MGELCQTRPTDSLPRSGSRSAQPEHRLRRDSNLGPRLRAEQRELVSRRCFLAGAGSLAAAALLPDIARAAASPITHNVGSLEVTIISDGVLQVPLSFFLPQTPPAEAAALLKQHGLPETGSPSQTNVVLIKTGDELVLIDAGSGPNFQPTAGKLQENMEAAGLAPDKVTRIVFTHAHADHLWGAIDDFGDGDRFPNADYVIAAAEWDFWIDPSTAEKMPDVFKGMAAGTARVLKRIEGKVQRRGGGDAVAKGVRYLPTPGHTPGHMAVLVEDAGQRLVVGGDTLLNTAISFARPDWPIGSDLDRDQAIATRKALLAQLASERTPLIGFHLAWPGLGMVERAGHAYRFIPL